MALELSNFNAHGLSMDMLALCSVSGGAANVRWLYQSSVRGGSDTPIAGELGIGDGNTVFEGIRWDTNDDVLILNDNDNPGALNLGTYFGSGGAGRDLTFYFQTEDDGVMSFTVADNFVSAGGNFLRMTPPAAVQTVLDQLATNERFIVGFGRPLPAVTATLLAPISAWHSSGTSYGSIWGASDPNHLADLGPLADPSGAVRLLNRMDIRARDIGGGVIGLRIIIRITDDAADFGTSGSGQNLISAWETNPVALRFTAPGLTDLVLHGSDVASNTRRDTTEAYDYWYAVPQPAAENWFRGFAALNASQRQQATVTFTSVPPPPASHTVAAGDAAWSFAVAEPAVAHARNHTVGAGDAAWSFAVAEPAVAHARNHTVDAGDAAWSFAVAEPTVVRARNHAVDAGGAAWSFAVAEPAVTRAAGAVDAGGVSWLFTVSAVPPGGVEGGTPVVADEGDEPPASASIPLPEGETQVRQIWRSIPDAWEALEGSARLKVEAFWAGMEQVVIQLLADLNRVGIDPFIEHARPTKADLWCRFYFSGGEELAIDEDIVSIPVLQDAIASPTRRWVENTDYSMLGHAIVWAEGQTPPSGVVWAPVVNTNNDHASQVLGGPVGVDLVASGWDSPTALKTLRCLWYCYQHGPTMENMRYALNAMMALPFMAHAGRVLSIEGDQVTVVYGDSQYGLSDYEGTVVCGDPIEIADGTPGGESDERFKGAGTVLYDRRIVEVADSLVQKFDESLRNFAVDPDNIDMPVWVVPDIASQRPTFHIVRRHKGGVAPISERQTNGTTVIRETDFDSYTPGTVLLGSGEWGEVRPGDVLSVTSPSGIAGRRRIDSVLSSDTEITAAGTVSVDIATDGNEIVTGTGTSFRTAGVESGDVLIVEGEEYGIASVNSDTELRINEDLKKMFFSEDITTQPFRVVRRISHGIYLQTPLPADTEDIAYTVERPSWIEVEGELEPGDMMFSVVRAGLEWRDDMWIGSRLIDAEGGIHTITSNSASVVRCASVAAGGSPMQIRPNFLGGDDREVFSVFEQAAVVPKVGEYLRRFEPILDGVRLTDWRADDRWRRWEPATLALAADGTGMKTVEVENAAGVTIGAVYWLCAIDQPKIEVEVVGVSINPGSNDVITLDKDISSDYGDGEPSDPMTMEALPPALLVPTRRPVEGLSGFFVVKEGSPTGSTSADGFTLTDDNSDNPAMFTTQARVGDRVRLIEGTGTEHLVEVDLVGSDTSLTVVDPLPGSLSDVYYQIVKPYLPEELSTIDVDLAPYAAEYYDRDLVEAVLNRLRPTHVGYEYTDTTIEVLNVSRNPLEDDYQAVVRVSEAPAGTDDFDLMIVDEEPNIVDSRLNSSDRLNNNFIVGPSRYRWAAEEVYWRDVEYLARRTSPARVICRIKSGSEGNALSQGPTGANGAPITASGGMNISEVRIREDLDMPAPRSLQITRSSTFSFRDWVAEYGLGMSFYFVIEGAGGGTVEFPVSDATVAVQSISWNEAHRAMLLSSGQEMKLVVATSGGLGGRGVRRPVVTGAVAERPS